MGWIVDEYHQSQERTRQRQQRLDDLMYGFPRPDPYAEELRRQRQDDIYNRQGCYGLDLNPAAQARCFEQLR